MDWETVENAITKLDSIESDVRELLSFAEKLDYKMEPKLIYELEEILSKLNNVERYIAEQIPSSALEEYEILENPWGDL